MSAAILTTPSLQISKELDSSIDNSVFSSSSSPVRTSSSETTSGLLSHKPSIKTGLDWIATLTPRKRSCISFDNVEPCVNKAVAGLETLKDALSLKNETTKCSTVRIKSVPDVRMKSVSSMQSDEDRVDPQSDVIPLPELAVQGVPTGIIVEKMHSKMQPVEEAEGWNDLIGGVLSLVARLEHDRQDTLISLSKEKVRAEQLEEKLDKECENRLIILPKLVQAEHERCFRNIRDLKWHVNFERRKLQKLEGSLKVISKKNEEFKNELKYLTEINPKLEEKLIFEQGRMRAIAQNQQDTSDELYQAKHTTLELGEQHGRTKLLADSEKKRTEERRHSLTLILRSKNNKLHYVESDVKDVSTKIIENTVKIIDYQKQAKKIDIQYTKSDAEYHEIVPRTDSLNENLAKTDKEVQKLKGKENKMRATSEAEHEKMEEIYCGQMLELEEQRKDLRTARAEKEDLEHEIEALRASIILREKQLESDVKTIKRAHRDLIKLEGELEVSMEEFVKVKSEHHALSEEYTFEKEKAADKEDMLKDNVESLKLQLREEKKHRLIYENKIQADSAVLEKLRADCQKRLEQAQAISSQLEDQNSGQAGMVKELEEAHTRNTKLLESLQSELTAVKEEHETTERDLGGRKTLLVPQERQLREEVQEKAVMVEILKDKIKELEENLEDMIKSCRGVEKLERNTSSAIDQLRIQLDALEKKLAIEVEKEQSWRDEHKEISDFSAEAEANHAKYLEERHELLRQHKLDLQKGLTTNSNLAENYHQLQTKFIDIKSRALGVIEKKLELETSLRDHKQLEAFQSCMYYAMKEYYQNREASSRRDLGDCHSQCQKNMSDILSLKDQFKTVLALLQDFLEFEATV